MELALRTSDGQDRSKEGLDQVQAVLHTDVEKILTETNSNSKNTGDLLPSHNSFVQNSSLIKLGILPDLKIESPDGSAPPGRAGASAQVDINDPFGGEGVANVSADSVKQFSYGDCFFEAALASLAQTKSGQTKIMNMVQGNRDGSYKVTFAGDTSHPVQVTQNDLGQYGTTNDTNWANIIETGFLKRDQAIPDYQKDLIGGGISARELISGNAATTTPQQALALLTGQDISSYATANLSSEAIKHDLQLELSSGHAVTVSSNEVPGDQSVSGPESGYSAKPGSAYPIAGNHQFSVTSYDPANSVITLRNPWGTETQGGALKKKGQIIDGITNQGDGNISMSLETFQKYFSEIDMAGINQTSSSALHLTSDLSAGNFLNALGDTRDLLVSGF